MTNMQQEGVRARTSAKKTLGANRAAAAHGCADPRDNLVDLHVAALRCTQTKKKRETLQTLADCTMQPPNRTPRYARVDNLPLGTAPANRPL